MIIATSPTPPTGHACYAASWLGNDRAPDEIARDLELGAGYDQLPWPTGTTLAEDISRDLILTALVASGLDLADDDTEVFLHVRVTAPVERPLTVLETLMDRVGPAGIVRSGLEAAAGKGTVRADTHTYSGIAVGDGCREFFEPAQGRGTTK